MWRYREAIPINYDENIVSLGEPVTPLLKLKLGGKSIWVKIDHLFPTGSFKDRGAAVLISKMRELGIKKAVEDSSGNAGAAIAAYCKAAGINCDVFIPASTSASKALQIELYGASLKKVEGSRSDTAAAALKDAAKAYYASHCRNPFFIQGVKTFAFETAEQLGWNAPDTLILPVGNGTLLLGAYIGFGELQNAGLIKKIPKFIGVQAANCSPLYNLFSAGTASSRNELLQSTAAEGIAVAEPVRGKEILSAVRQSGGCIIAVDEEKLKTALKDMLAEGFLIEPTAAAAIAGAKDYLSSHNRNETIVTAVTGGGMKSLPKIVDLLNMD